MNVSQNQRLFAAYIVFAALILFGGLLPEVFSNIISRLIGEDPGVVANIFILLFMLIILFFIFQFLVERAGEIFGSSATIFRQEQEQPKRFLIMGYSPMGKSEISSATAHVKEVPLNIIASSSDTYNEYLSTNNIKAPERFFWQQNVRSVYVHREKLERIYVLNPDNNQFEEFRTFLNLCFRDEIPNLEVECISVKGDKTIPFQVPARTGGGYEKVSYEYYHYVYEGLSRALEMIHEYLGTARNVDEQICIDATPGYKPFSIAAAIITLNRNLKFSYVTSGFGPEGGIVKFYDARIKTAASAS